MLALLEMKKGQQSLPYPFTLDLVHKSLARDRCRGRIKAFRNAYRGAGFRLRTEMEEEETRA